MSTGDKCLVVGERKKGVNTDKTQFTSSFTSQNIIIKVRVISVVKTERASTRGKSDKGTGLVVIS